MDGWMDGWMAWMDAIDAIVSQLQSDDKARVV